MSDLQTILLLAGCFVAGFVIVGSVMSARKDKPKGRSSDSPDDGR